MLRNFFNPKTHIGEQPVRVLKWNIASQLENVHAEFPQEYREILAKHGLTPSITYDYRKKPLVSITYPYSDPIPLIEEMIPHVNGKKEIVIQEVFLSYLWILCYCHLVIFSESLQKHYLRQIGRDVKTDLGKLHEAERFYDNALGLISEYSDWKIPDLPNPEHYDDENKYIEQANGLFVHAMNFVLLHELGHIKLGHLEPAKRRDRNDVRIKDEKLADAFAIDAMLKGVRSSDDKYNRGMGMVVGMGALLLSNSDPVNTKHPDNDDRLETLLTKLQLKGGNLEWAFGWVSFRLWSNTYKKNFSTPVEAGDFKELFYDAYNQSRQGKTSVT